MDKVEMLMIVGGDIMETSVALRSYSLGAGAEIEIGLDNFPVDARLLFGIALRAPGETGDVWRVAEHLEVEYTAVGGIIRIAWDPNKRFEKKDFISKTTH